MAVFPSDSIRTKNWGTEILTDSDLEAQFDLLHAYFTACLNSSTGHTHDGTANQGPKLTTLGTVACTLPINFAKGTDIASAATTDIGAATGNVVDITGTTTITALGTVQAGTMRFIRFTGALTLTHNATSLILPGSANITTAAGDEAIMVSLGSGNWRCANYQRKDGTAITGATVTTALAGSVIQTVNVQDGATATTATVLPIDDTIPQNTEGGQFMSLAITPNNANNKLKITVVVFGNEDADTSNVFGVALFQDATANALASGTSKGATGTQLYPDFCTFTHYMTAGTTSATTFKVRAGIPDAGTFRFNGANGGRFMGGTLASSITIEEIKV